jgi:poly(A) polymerase
MPVIFNRMEPAMNDREVPEPRILARAEHCLSRRNIDPDARKVMMRLNRNGFKAYLVGGSVRDLLLQKQPKDFDVSTDARPGQIKKLFRNCRIIGRRFRLAHIYFPDSKIIELSTFRKRPIERTPGDNDTPEDGKHVDNTFGEPHEDAMRRDLTINGLFYDIESFAIIDYVGGIDDLQAGIIRTIGNPKERFQEDPLRMIRTVRHAVQAGFHIEPDTYSAILECASLLKQSNTSRVQDDVQKDLERGFFASVLRLQMETGILNAYFPELDRYLRSDDDPCALFDPAWIWQALSRLDSGEGQFRNPQRFRMAALFFPLLENALLQIAEIGSDPYKNVKETHLHLLNLCTPVGIQRHVREDLKTLWGAWIRLIGSLASGKIPIRFQKKPYFENVCEWHRFCGPLLHGSGRDSITEIQQAVGAGTKTINRRRRRRKKTGKPS